MTLSDFATLQMVLVGMLVSVLTLLFATIVSKREEYRSIRRSTESTLRNRVIEVNNNIIKLKRYCSQLLSVIVVSFMLYIVFTVFNNVCCKEYLCLASCIAGILTLGVMVWIIILTVNVVKYFKDIDH